MVITKFFSIDDCDVLHHTKTLKLLKNLSKEILAVEVENCYYIETSNPLVSDSFEVSVLKWLLKSPQGTNMITNVSNLPSTDKLSTVIEIGPRFNFSTPFSTNCLNICHNVGLLDVLRLEKSTRYYIRFKHDLEEDNDKIFDLLGDKMTECIYTEKNVPRNSFNENLSKNKEPWFYVPVIEEGRAALEKVNEKLGLSFGNWDLDYYTNLFKNILRRNPTSIELFDCAQSNSEHSRHWFFRGKMIIDGKEQPKSLIRMIMDTQNSSNNNNTIKFSDNSSAIKGFKHKMIRLSKVDGPAAVSIKNVDSDLIFTAETHNMPTAVSPFSGATTGTGGRIRDVQAVGRGGLPIAGTAGYCVGCLNIPGWEQPYENAKYQYPLSFAKPLNILIDGSNGVSDYGNKFGEPVINGFAYSYGMTNAEGERVEYVKPILFSGGLGIMDASMRSKILPERGMLLAKIGGPVYRIGVGGGAASSVEVQGSNCSQLDFDAVQRGDAEMENKLNRVVRACIEMGEKNPILAIHDQGAGGNGNVLKELVEPGLAGAIIFSKEFQLGDPTITTLELWGAEYQENNAILCKFEDRQILENICQRERCPINFVGIVTGDGFVTLMEEEADFDKALALSKNRSLTGAFPFDLELKHVLGDIPKREYILNHRNKLFKTLQIANDFDISKALEKVFSLVSVGSKRYLTNKVDRCVTGLIVQQQCVGPLHTPLADYGLVAVSHFGFEGIATSIGAQPIKGLLNAKAMARMSVAEALSNLVFVKISGLSDVKCSGNWMWAAKLPGEGAEMFDACQEMCSIMKDLEIAIDGGKDSLSMAAKVDDEVIKSPGTLVISTYAPCPDVRLRVTPDLKGPASGTDTSIIWINIESSFRLGGSAFAQVIGQQGNHCPTVMRSDLLKKAFNITQNLLQEKKILSGHDISDGGLIVCLLEMAFGGISGVLADISSVCNNIPSENLDEAARNNPELAILFSEECGWLIEVDDTLLQEITSTFTQAGVPNYVIGKTMDYGLDSNFTLKYNGFVLLNNEVRHFYKQWERVSFEIEKLQSNYDCAVEEYNSLDFRCGPTYYCSADIKAEMVLKNSQPIRVAVLREEGANSDKELMSCLLKANFEVHDVTMSDLITRQTFLENYRGIIFPGGFSYADTLGSAKGWAANIMFSKILGPQFLSFKQRKNTFSLGICNGCQLMALINWVGDIQTKSDENKYLIDDPDVALLHNRSGRFECRWSSVKIAKSNSILLANMEHWVLGCWIAHGEGQFSFRNSDILNKLKMQNCIALHYVDDNLHPTTMYPMNPNGSIEGIAGICSSDGRHLALMPHPERCGSMHLWPYIPPEFVVNSSESPWQLMFNNGYKWCTNQIKNE